MWGFNILNSGEARYLSNSDCQSSLEMGGNEPVTGFHSVILSLFMVSHWDSIKLYETYPDSVNRVRPPNTTMPNTLAALPNNQYATPFEDVSGKNRLPEAFAFCLSALEIVWLKELSGDAFLIVPGTVSCNVAALLLHRMFRDNVDLEERLIWRRAERDCFIH